MAFKQFIPTIMLAVALIVVMFMNNNLMASIQVQQQQAARDALPVSDWYEVNTLWVDDFELGADPRMLTDRVIKQDFYGTWTTDFEKMTNEGAIYLCGFSGRADYTTDAKLPNPLTLSWWLYEHGNKLSDCFAQFGVGAGEYRICTTWRVFPTGYNEKRTRICSNVFQITRPE